ncbi:MAG: prepilin-type N-terminal cleavage/methylation domain-containing protein [Desulfobacter sp.]
MISNEKGFSLIELMIALAIFSMIVGFMATSKTRQQETNVTQLQAVEMQQNVRTVMFMMKKNIRQAGFNPTASDQGQGIITATATSFSFSYYNTDTTALDTATYVFEDDEGDGDMDITLNGTILAENIQNLSFTYYDEDRNTPVADVDDIRSVDITITAAVDQDELARAATRTLTTSVYMRNMGL